MTDREKFEAWFSKLTMAEVPRYKDGDYMSALARHSWIAWQAACKYKDDVHYQQPSGISE